MPGIFAGNSRDEPVRQAKFEYMCAFLAAALVGVGGKARRAILEEMIDRLEIGLREAGVSDIKVGKEVRTYAAAMNGRLERYIPLIENEKWTDLELALESHGLQCAGLLAKEDKTGAKVAKKGLRAGKK